MKDHYCREGWRRGSSLKDAKPRNRTGSPSKTTTVATTPTSMPVCPARIASCSSRSSSLGRWRRTSSAKRYLDPSNFQTRKDGPPPIKKIKTSDRKVTTFDRAPIMNSSHKNKSTSKTKKKIKRFVPIFNTHLNKEHPLGGLADLEQYMEDYQKNEFDNIGEVRSKLKEQVSNRVGDMSQKEEKETNQKPGKYTYEKGLRGLCKKMDSLDLKGNSVANLFKQLNSG